MMGVYGRRCLRPSCQGTVTFEVSVLVCEGGRVRTDRSPQTQYTDAQLYDQLRYYAYLFDVEAAKKATKGTKKAGK